MPPLLRHRPTTPEEASALLARPGHAAMGGGTDLLAQLEAGLAHPAALVDLHNAARGVTLDAAGELRIGAAEPTRELAAHRLVREHAAALADACAIASGAAGGTASEGTLGGNLCHRPGCQYFRRRDACRKHGGDSCPAVDGDNRFHAILGGGPCWIVHPSHAAVALVALEARLELAAAGSDRTVAAADFFVLPSVRLDHETVLAPGEWVRTVVIPAASLGGHQRYHAAHGDGAPDVVTLAATRRTDGEVRLVLGGVAPVPWRVYGSIEEDAKVGNLAEDDVETLAERALYDAEPLAHNGYKVPLATALLRDAIRAMWV